MSNHWVSSSWNQRLPGFCESNLNAKHEYVNTFTSLFIIFWGIYGMFQLPSSKHQTSDTWRLIFSLLTCVGIGSTLFHWTLYVGWGLLDSLPMLLAEYVALFQVFEIICRVQVQGDSLHKSLFNVIGKVLSITLTVFAMLSIIYTALYGQHHFLFVLIFTVIPIVILVVVVWSALDPKLFKNQIKESTQYQVIFRHLWVGFGLAATAGIIWNTMESLCDQICFFKLIPFHGIWHFFIGYGMFNLIQVGVFIDFDINYKDETSSYEMAVRTTKDATNIFQRIWYFAVPVLFCKNKYPQNDPEII